MTHKTLVTLRIFKFNEKINPHCYRKQWQGLRRPPWQKAPRKARSKSLKKYSLAVFIVVVNTISNDNQMRQMPPANSRLLFLHFLPGISRLSFFTSIVSTIVDLSLSWSFFKTCQVIFIFQHLINHDKRSLQPVEEPPWLQSRPRGGKPRQKLLGWNPTTSLSLPLQFSWFCSARIWDNCI